MIVDSITAAAARAERPLCVHHGNCADGYGAAWAVAKRLPGVELFAGVHGEPPPVGLARGRDVIVVDFSYPYEQITQLSFAARSLLILDHHFTAAEALGRLPRARCGPRDGRGLRDDPWGYFQVFVQAECHSRNMPLVAAEFDMGRSGAVMAWEFFHPGEPVPRLLRHVQDRDLWRFALDGTREVQANLFSHPYDLRVWDALVERCETPDGWLEQRLAGAAIERKHHKDVAELLAVTRRTMLIGGVQVPVANLPYTLASDAAGLMAAEAGVPFAACYFDKPGARVFSLRSGGRDGRDVSAVAALYRGGGHRNAAGFQTRPGWEGDGDGLEGDAGRAG